MKLDIEGESLERVGHISTSFVECLASSQDGLFYGVDVLGDSLIRINPVSGEGSLVGPMGVFATGLEGRPDLAEDETGQLWMIVDQALYRVDRENGAGLSDCQASAPVMGLTFVNAEKITGTGPPGNPGCGLQYGGPDSPWLETGPDRWVYGLYYLTPTAPGTGMRRMNPATGEEQTLAVEFWGYDLMGLAFVPDAQPPHEAPIPALDRRGVFAMCMLLGFAGLACLRNRSSAM